MGERESTEMAVEAGSESSAHSSPPWLHGSWWWHRHFHVPVAVWLLASVLGGAAIGDALEPERTPAKAPTTEVVSEPVAASDVEAEAEVECVSTNVAAGADVDGSSSRAKPVQALNGIDCD